MTKSLSALSRTTLGAHVLPGLAHEPTWGRRVHAGRLGPVDPVERRRHLDVDRLARRGEVLGGEAVVDAAALEGVRVREVAVVHGGPVGGARRRRGGHADGADGADDDDEGGQGGAQRGVHGCASAQRRWCRRMCIGEKVTVLPVGSVIAVPNRFRVRCGAPWYRAVGRADRREPAFTGSSATAWRCAGVPAPRPFPIGSSGATGATGTHGTDTTHRTADACGPYVFDGENL